MCTEMVVALTCVYMAFVYAVFYMYVFCGRACLSERWRLLTSLLI